MKRLPALLLAIIMIAALAACSGSETAKSDGGDSGSDTAEPTEAPVLHIKDDHSVPGMSFTPPDGYTSVERLIDKNADGTLKEKNVKFIYDEDTSLSFGYSKSEDENLADLTDLSKLESAEYDGQTFYFYPSGSNITALLQIDKSLYGVEYARPKDSEDKDKLEEALKSIKFETVETVEDNDEGLEAISYELDPDLQIAGTSSNQEEDLDGNLIKKSMTWRFGKDADDINFRFLIRVVKNSKVADELNEETEYVDEKLGDVDYKVRKDGDISIEYFAQIGSDVYEIKNLGSYNGWMTTRSDESHAAFEKFMKTVKFSK